MKLVRPDLECKIRIEFENINIWVIESPTLFQKYVHELLSQTEGAEGDFVLSEGMKELDVSKIMELVVNPFSVDINDRKILNKLYLKLSEMAIQEGMFMQTQSVKAELQNYFFSLEHLTPYILETDLEIDVTSLLKAMGVKFVNYADDLLENISQYITILAELLRKRVLILVNAQSYFNEEQLFKLQKNAMYSEVALLLIENRQKSFSHPSSSIIY